MSAKAKSKEANHHFEDRSEIEELRFLNKVLDNDLKIARGLLQESVAQLSKTNDEYHSDLRDKIIKEIGE